MAFSFHVLNKFMIDKVNELNDRIDIFDEENNHKIIKNEQFYIDKINSLEKRIDILEGQCKILTDLFNICRNHTIDNKLIQTMILDLTSTVQHNSLELEQFKKIHFSLSNKTINNKKNYDNISNLNNIKISNINNDGKWTKVKKKKKRK